VKHDKKALEAIDQVVASSLVDRGPIALQPDYLRAIEVLESLPENQDGAKKGWVLRSMGEHAALLAKARRL